MNTPKQQKPFFLYIIISILAVAVIGLSNEVCGCFCHFLYGILKFSDFGLEGGKTIQ